jgi:hypothetical protein
MLGTEFQLPLDASGFSLRRCPRCDSAFKVRRTVRDAGVLASALAGRIHHLNGTEADAAPVTRHCPYCGTTAPAESWWTEGQRRWFGAQARSLAEEIRWRWLQLPFELLGQNPRPTYVTVPPNLALEAEPDEELEGELTTVPLPCCGEEIRVTEAWVAPVRCHFCGLVHARRAVRDAWVELAQLRSWATPR